MRNVMQIHLQGTLEYFGDGWRFIIGDYRQTFCLSWLMVSWLNNSEVIIWLCYCRSLYSSWFRNHSYLERTSKTSLHTKLFGMYVCKGKGPISKFFDWADTIYRWAVHTLTNITDIKHHMEAIFMSFCNFIMFNPLKSFPGKFYWITHLHF